jgi:2,3-bisphosphoglycerate-independent phosphoglycerate mutase
MDRRKILLLIFDGLGDRPIPELARQTPLQTARKEHLDWFAENGVNGLMDPIAPGVKPGSDTSHLALFGYDSLAVYTGRGPFEAAGVGIPVRRGDIAFRCNLATVDSNMRVMDRRAGRIKDGTHDLAAALDGLQLDGGVRVLFRAGTEHRAALVLRGAGLSPHVTDSDPHEEGAVVASVAATESDGGATAHAVNAFTRECFRILKDHPVNMERATAGLPPANMVLLRGAGIVPDLEPIGERFHLKAAGIAGVGLIKGICRAVGMDVLEVAGATGGLDTDMVAKASAALEALKTYDLVAVNVKAPDVCGHDGLANEKVRTIERIDAMMATLKIGLGPEVVLAATADHSTPVMLKDHSADPVPVLIFGEGVRVDDVQKFDEISAAKGGLGRIRGLDLLPILLDLAGRSEKFGA